MDTRHLIDGIVRQTTVLIAQLSTVAGIRAPLSRVADQVFLNLARELETQGVGRKVAADMFGLALRSYQLKINRLTASATASEQTLWEALIEYLEHTSGASRRNLMEHFRKDDPGDIGAILTDLVEGGLVARAGRGDSAFYQLASREAVEAVAAEEGFEALTNLVWLAVYDRQKVERAELVRSLPFDGAHAERAIDRLLSDGRIAREERDGTDTLVCRRLAIPVGAAMGWEAAVFDHFRALATAVASKLARTGPRSNHGDVVGGTTLGFSIHPGHPFEEQVLSLLTRTRAELQELWNQVVAHNEAHPIEPEERTEVTFYFGQMVVPPDGDGKA